MTEQQAIEALHALPRLPRSGASLERMQALLDHLGNPEKQFKRGGIVRRQLLKQWVSF